LLTVLKRLFARVEAVAAKILIVLQRLYNRLTEKLDRALDKLDEVTKSLLRKYYRALEYLEKLFRILQKLLRVLLPILLLFVPPATGFLLAYFAFQTYPSDSIVVASMSFILLLILIASFLSKAESTTAETIKTQAPLAVVAELDNYSFERKIIGTLIALIFLAAAAYLNIGLFVGILLFIFEVVVLYGLKWIYGADKNQAVSTPA
jgi:hypothetical protein